MSRVPPRMTFPLFRPEISEEAIAASAEVMRSGWLGTGPRVDQFEQAFAAMVGAPHCVAVSSCSAALDLALRISGAGPGDDVITTPMTFIATNQAILRAGARPVFADIDPATGNVAAASIRQRLTDATTAIMVVHYGGMPCDLDEIYAVAADRGIKVIEDCAHATGATYGGEPIGSHPGVQAFSFNPVKHIPMAEGGAVTLRAADDAQHLRRLRWFGMDRDSYTRAQNGHAWDYSVTDLGFRCAMNDVNAAMGLAHLGRLRDDIHRREEIAARYRERLRGVSGLELTRIDPDRTSSHYFFSVLAENRDGLVRALRNSGIEAWVHFRPNDQFPIFQRADLPGVESFWSREVSLPVQPLRGTEDVDAICDVVAAGW